MRLDSVKSVLALGVAVHLGVFSAIAASPAIGTIAAKGSFRVDNATVQGNATLFEGAAVETTLPASLNLTTGTQLMLASASKGRVYGDRLVLEKGEGQLEGSTAFRLEALGLTIQPDTSVSSGRVILNGADRVQVAASRGSFRVLNPQGILVANVVTGSALEFQPLKGVPTSRVTGIPRAENGRVLLTDETTRVTLEVAGAGIDKQLGNRVTATGALDQTARPASDASHVMRVVQLAQATKPNTTKSGPQSGGSASSGSAAGKGTAAPAGVGGSTGGTSILGMSVTTVAIIGGVATAGTLGGLAAAGTFNSR